MTCEIFPLGIRKRPLALHALKQARVYRQALRMALSQRINLLGLNSNNVVDAE